MTKKFIYVVTSEYTLKNTGGTEFNSHDNHYYTNEDSALHRMNKIVGHNGLRDVTVKYNLNENFKAYTIGFDIDNKIFTIKVIRKRVFD